MSSAYQYPGQAYVHTLTALKGYYVEGALDAEVKPTGNVNIGSAGLPLNSGTTTHVTGVNTVTDFYGGPSPLVPTFQVEMGCGQDQGYPLWLWPGSNEPDISNPGVLPGTPAAGSGTTPPDFLAVFPGQAGIENMPALVGAPGRYEIETTEFDTAQTYAAAQYLRAVTSNTDANAGKVTNQNASGGAPFASPGLVAFGTDTVVGIVSRGSYLNANKIKGLALWTHWNRGTR